MFHCKSPGLKSDILHGKTGFISRNLPLHRISCVQSRKDYYTVKRPVLQGFSQIFSDFFYIELLTYFLHIFVHFADVDVLRSIIYNISVMQG